MFCSRSGASKRLPSKKMGRLAYSPGTCHDVWLADMCHACHVHLRHRFPNWIDHSSVSHPNRSCPRSFSAVKQSVQHPSTQANQGLPKRREWMQRRHVVPVLVPGSQSFAEEYCWWGTEEVVPHHSTVPVCRRCSVGYRTRLPLQRDIQVLAQP